MVEGSSSGLPEKTGLFALNMTGIDPWPPASDAAAQGFWGLRGGQERRGRAREKVGVGREDKGKQSVQAGHHEGKRIPL